MKHFLAFIASFFICVMLFMGLNFMITIDTKKNENKTIFEQIAISLPQSSSKETQTIKPLPIEKFEIKTEPLKIELPNLMSTNSVALEPIKNEFKPLQDQMMQKNTKNDSITIQTPSFERIDSFLAVYKQEPRYPRLAKKNGISGQVVIEFKINPSGEVFEAKIIKATPPNIFDDSALRAIKKWRFNPFEKGYKISTATFNFGISS